MKNPLPNTVDSQSRFGISEISTYCPPGVLPNAWYQEILPRKFVRHTGIVNRAISFEDEVTMACRSVQDMVRDTGCDLDDCAAVVFASPSFVPMAVAHRYWNRERARHRSDPVVAVPAEANQCAGAGGGIQHRVRLGAAGRSTAARR